MDGPTERLIADWHQTRVHGVSMCEGNPMSLLCQWLALWKTLGCFSCPIPEIQRLHRCGVSDGRHVVFSMFVELPDSDPKLWERLLAGFVERCVQFDFMCRNTNSRSNSGLLVTRTGKLILAEMVEKDDSVRPVVREPAAMVVSSLNCEKSAPRHDFLFVAVESSEWLLFLPEEALDRVVNAWCLLDADLLPCLPCDSLSEM